MDNNTLYTIIGAVLTSNVIAVLASGFMSKKKESASTDGIVSDNWKKIFDEISNDRERIKYDYDLINARESKQKEEIANQKAEIEKLKSEFMLFRSFRQQLPIAWWIKNMQGQMKELSDEYERIFLIPNGITKDDYVGFTDYDVWPHDIAVKYVEHDKRVMDTKKSSKFREMVNIDGQLKVLRVEKIPIIFGDHVWGSMGFAYFEEWEPG